MVDEDRVEEALTAQLHPIFAAIAAGGRGRVLRKGGYGNGPHELAINGGCLRTELFDGPL